MEDVDARTLALAAAVVDWLADEYGDEDPRIIMLALTETVGAFVGQIRPGMTDVELLAFVDELAATVREQVDRKRN